VTHEPKDDVEVALSVTTPAGAAKYILDQDVPPEYRAAVRQALPLLMTDNFVEAAHLIRYADRQ